MNQILTMVALTIDLTNETQTGLMLAGGSFETWVIFMCPVKDVIGLSPGAVHSLRPGRQSLIPGIRDGLKHTTNTPDSVPYQSPTSSLVSFAGLRRGRGQLGRYACQIIT